MPGGRPKSEAALNLEKIFKINEDQFVRDGKVVPPNDAIWSILQEKLKSSENKSSKNKSTEKKEKTIYTAALRWYEDTKKDRKKLNDSCETTPKNVSFETSFETSGTSDASETSTERSPKKDCKKIQIKIAPKVWRTIEPRPNLNKRKRKGSHKTGVRKYVTLAPGLWTNVFADEVSKYDDIPCSWVFKRNKCYLSGQKYLEFNAKCNTCNASLVGALTKQPAENVDVNIGIEIYDIDLQKHQTAAKKVKMTSAVAKSLYLTDQKATVIRRNLLKSSTQMFKEPTCRTMTANAIRCAQYRDRKKEKISQCPMTALSYLKQSNLYMNCIQRIGLDPFFAFYCTPEQKKLFNAFSEKNKLLKVSCDATGGVVNKIGKDFP